MRTAMIIALLILVACSNEEGVCLRSTGESSTRTVELEYFDEVALMDNIDYEIIPHQPAFKAEVVGGKNLLDGINFKQDSSFLQVTSRNRCNWVRTYGKKPKVKLYLDTLRQITYMGSGKVTFADTNHVDIFLYSQWDGSGDVHMLLDAKETYLKMNTGVGDIYPAGRTGFLYTYSLCQGFIFGKELIAGHSHTVNRSLGDFYINVTDSMLVELHNLGNVYVPGGTKTRLIVTGKGRLLTY